MANIVSVPPNKVFFAANKDSFRPNKVTARGEQGFADAEQGFAEPAPCTITFGSPTAAPPAVMRQSASGGPPPETDILRRKRGASHGESPLPQPHHRSPHTRRDFPQSHLRSPQEHRCIPPPIPTDYRSLAHSAFTASLKVNTRVNGRYRPHEFNGQPHPLLAGRKVSAGQTWRFGGLSIDSAPASWRSSTISVACWATI